MIGLHLIAPRSQLLAGYFLLLPLRDEAGVSLGTHRLPVLFLASLLLTLVATPFASLFLARHTVAKERGVQQLYRFLSASVLGRLGERGQWGGKEGASGWGCT